MREQLDQLTPPPVKWLSPGEIRDTGSKRTRRKRTVTLLAIALMAAGSGYQLSHHDLPAGGSTCTPFIAVPAVTEKDLKVQLFVDSADSNTKLRLLSDLHDRNIDALGIASLTSDGTTSGVATIYFHEPEFDAALLMNSYLFNQGKLVIVDDKLPQMAEPGNGVLDVSIGPDFKQFATPTEAQQSFSQERRAVAYDAQAVSC